MDFLSLANSSDVVAGAAELIFKQGIVVVMMALAIRWLNSSREKIEAQREEERLKRWGDVKEHIGDLKARIVALENEVRECHAERQQLAANLYKRTFEQSGR